MTNQRNILLFKAQFFSSRNFYLLFYQVNICNHFCDRMLYLQPGIHFQKIEI
jgi:hypothetical protein